MTDDIQEAFLKLLDVDESEQNKLLQNEYQSIASELKSLLAANKKADVFFEKTGLKYLEELRQESEIPDYNVGDKILDYIILERLGSGSFGKVYLAHQISLDRKVCLKITKNLGNEARTMAKLEHPNIVQIYSEQLLVEQNQRVICMQFIQGESLDKELVNSKKGHLSSEEQFNYIINILEGLVQGLRFAHRRKILHLDIKPSNVLRDLYGKIFLTDFNISLSKDAGITLNLVGGTKDFMSPEQELYLKGDRGIDLDERADVFAVGIVLKNIMSRISCMNLGLMDLVEKAMERNRDIRISDMDEFLRRMEDLKELERLKRELPEARGLTRFTLNQKIFSLLVLAMVPQILGSLVNVSYNSIQIVSGLNAVQKDIFSNLCLVYNTFTYPICMALYVWFLWPILKSLKYGQCSDVVLCRKRILNLPLAIVVLSIAGWLPGGIIFPAVLSRFTPDKRDLFIHFFVSFSLSGLIAMAYSFLFLQYLSVRIIYPHFLSLSEDVKNIAEKELNCFSVNTRIFHLFASFIPVVGAALAVYVGPEGFTEHSYQHFRILVTILIGMGTVGVFFGLREMEMLTKLIQTLKGSRN